MELTIEIPEKVVERAAALGVPVSTLVSRALEEIGQEEIAEEPIPEGFALLRGPGKPRMTAQEATIVIRDIQSRNTLGGLKIKDLIEEGRRG